MTLKGYAARYGVLSNDLGGFRERIQKGAFDKVLRSKDLDCAALVNHDANQVIGRTPRTLQLRSDNVGLYFECTLPDTQIARDCFTNVMEGNINACSFSFTTDNERMCDYREEKMYDPDFDEDEEGVMPNRAAQSYTYRVVRTIRDFESLLDVSVLSARPAYPGTSVSARDLVLVGAECRNLATRTTRVRLDAEMNQLRARHQHLIELGAQYEKDLAVLRRRRQTLLDL
jgi:HK97 family phage prohead protease